MSNPIAGFILQGALGLMGVAGKAVSNQIHDVAREVLTEGVKNDVIEGGQQARKDVQETTRLHRDINKHVDQVNSVGDANYKYQKAVLSRR